MMKDTTKLSEGKESKGSWITKGAVTNRKTRPSRSLKKKIRRQQGKQVMGKVHNSLREQYGN